MSLILFYIENMNGESKTACKISNKACLFQHPFKCTILYCLPLKIHREPTSLLLIYKLGNTSAEAKYCYDLIVKITYNLNFLDMNIEYNKTILFCNIMIDDKNVTVLMLLDSYVANCLLSLINICCFVLFMRVPVKCETK